jgi:hypothetical protein
MPTYSYECSNCATALEIVCKMDERDLQVCDICNATLFRKVDRPGLVWAPTAGGMKT